MSPVDLVGLTPLMTRSRGRSETAIGLIDGPVVADHPGLATEMIRELPGQRSGRCALADSVACGHGTFVAGILSGRRDSAAPAICPGCTLLVRPIFPEMTPGIGKIPGGTLQVLAAAIGDCIDGGARVLNLSLALMEPSSRGERALESALGRAMQRGVIVVAAAGNQGVLGGTAITRHPWVIPVVASDLRGRPVSTSNLGRSIGRRGLSAPGDGVTSLRAAGGTLRSGGTSVAAPFVTGTIALLWSLFPAATAMQIKLAVTRGRGLPRTTVVPTLLDAWDAYQVLSRTFPEKQGT
jgi:subtilisin family serine protease